LEAPNFREDGVVTRHRLSTEAEEPFLRKGQVFAAWALLMQGQKMGSDGQGRELAVSN
jgi:hypothetical protein